MTDLSIAAHGKILTSNDIVSVEVVLEQLLRDDSTYGFGTISQNNIYGLNFFDAFDIIGTGLGYFDTLLQIAYGRGIYGYGLELTETIREDVDLIQRSRASALN